MASWIEHLPNQLQQALLIPILNISSPDKRVFIGFLLSSLVLALVVLYRNRQLTPAGIQKLVCPENYWLHPSARKDYQLMFSNSLIKTLLLAPILGTHLAGAIAVSFFLQNQLGNSPATNLPSWAVIALFSLIFFITEDFSRFALHRAMHKYPLLWHLHKTHHSAEVLTPFTLFRVHPAEMALYQLRQLLVFSLVSGIFIWLFRDQLNGWSILGVDALGFLFNAFGANLRHSHVWLSFGWLEKFFISPAQHQLHHSADIQHRNVNFGTCLAIWDRSSGSWRAAGVERIKLRFGLVYRQNSTR